MEPGEAIMAFSQSEKIKSGLIWASQAVEISNNIAGHEKQGAEKIIISLIGMILHEVQLAMNVAGSAPWQDIEKDIERALVMINSGVGLESVPHLIQALSKTTTVGQNSMVRLQEEGLI
ncbi:hypothetical protein ACFL2O_02225 [Thermodesulfobacteriota bacterium]